MKSINKLNKIFKEIKELKEVLHNEHSKIYKDVCPICLCKIGNNNRTILECRHIYHTSCYTDYIINECDKGGLETIIKCCKCKKVIIAKEYVCACEDFDEIPIDPIVNNSSSNLINTIFDVMARRQN